MDRSWGGAIPDRRLAGSNPRITDGARRFGVYAVRSGGGPIEVGAAGTGACFVRTGRTLGRHPPPSLSSRAIFCRRGAAGDTGEWSISRPLGGDDHDAGGIPIPSVKSRPPGCRRSLLQESWPPTRRSLALRNGTLMPCG